MRTEQAVDDPTVLIDARLGARGLGISSFLERLNGGFAATEGSLPSLWQASAPWGAKAVRQTLLRSGLFDLSPALDPRSRGYRVVHFASNLAPLAPGRRSVLTVHDLMHRRSSRPRTRMMGALLERSLTRVGRVAAVSGNTRDEIEEAFPQLAGRVEVIPHGLRTLPGSMGARTHLLAFGGSADPRKRTGLLIDVYRHYRSTPEPLPLIVLARAGLTAEQRSDLAALGARVVPDATQAEVDRLMAGAAALLYTTREEGFGLPVLEAAECGTPVVMDAGARVAGEVIGRHCVRVEGAQIDSWTQGLLDAIALGTVEQPLDLPGWSDVAGRYRALYREVAGA